MQEKWGWLCSELLKLGDGCPEVIILSIFITSFPLLLYVIEKCPFQKAKIARKEPEDTVGQEFKGLMVFSHESILLHVDIEMQENLP